jgi:hypothetical protein
MLSDSFAVPLVGKVYDQAGPAAALRTVSVLPLLVCIVFAMIWMRERKTA